MTSPLPRVLVHGGTGTQGSAVAAHLRAAGAGVVPLSRSGATPADLDDAGSLERAYAGAAAVVVTLPLVFAPGRAEEQAENVLTALRAAGVPRAVVNVGGPLLPVPVGIPYLDARALLVQGLADAVPTAAVVGPAGPYLENLSAAWSRPRLREGDLAYPLPEQAPVPWLALDDLAAVVAQRLSEDAPAAVTVVSGPEALTGDRAAAQLSEALGRPVRWRTVSSQEYGDLLVPHLGEQAGRGVAGFYAAPPPGAPALPAVEGAATVTGTTTLARWAAAQAWEG